MGVKCGGVSGTNHSSFGVSPATRHRKAVRTMTAPLMPVFTWRSQIFPQEFSQCCLFSPPQIPRRQAGRQEAWVLCSPGSLAQDCPGQYCFQSSLVGNGGFWEGLNLADSHSSVMKMFTTILLPTYTGFLTPLTSLLQRLQFNSVLTLSTWRKPQIPWVRGPVPQDFSPHFKSQAQVVACF